MYIYIYICISKQVKLATIVEDKPKAPFSIATTPRCRGWRYSFPGLLYFTLEPYLIMLSVKQGGIKYHFLSLWYIYIPDIGLGVRVFNPRLSHNKDYKHITLYF